MPAVVLFSTQVFVYVGGVEGVSAASLPYWSGDSPLRWPVGRPITSPCRRPARTVAVRCPLSYLQQRLYTVYVYTVCTLSIIPDTDLII